MINIEPYADLRGADLYEANLRGADLFGADLREANLRGADLFGADLRGVNLRGADLRGVNLRGADLRRANLFGVDLRGANLFGVDLRGVRGVISIQFDPRSYILVAYVHDGEIKIMAGCRNFTKPEAIAHWGSDDYHDKQLGRQYVRFIKQIYKKDLSQ